MAGRDMEWSSRRGQACGGAIPGGSSAEETGQGRWSEHQLGSGYPSGKDTEGGGSPWRRGDGGVVARGRRVAVRQRREPYGGRRWPGCVLPARRSRGRGEAPIDLKKWRTGWASTWKGTTAAFRLKSNEGRRAPSSGSRHMAVLEADGVARCSGLVQACAGRRDGERGEGVLDS
jgi:hypothetical protein